MSAEDASGGDKPPASAPAPKPAAATFSSFINSESPQARPLPMLSRGQKTRQARNLHPKPHDGDLAPLLLLLPQPPRLLLRQRHRRRLPNRKLHRLNPRPRMRPSLKPRMSHSCPHQLPPRNPQQRLLLDPPQVQPNPQQRFHSQPRPRPLPPPNPSPLQRLQVQRLRHKQTVSLTLLYRLRQTQVLPLNTWRMREAVVGRLRDVA